MGDPDLTRSKEEAWRAHLREKQSEVNSKARCDDEDRMENAGVFLSFAKA